MSYQSIALMQKDQQLRDRVASCCAREGHDNPEYYANQIMWQCVSHDDWAAAYEEAVAHFNSQPGADGRVITDHMILSAVQAATIPEQTNSGG